MGVERLDIRRKTGDRGILWPGVIVAWMIVAAPGWGAASPHADLSLSPDARGGATVEFSSDAPALQSARGRQVLAQSLGRALGGALEGVAVETDDGETIFTAHSRSAFLRRGLRVEGKVDPAP